MAKQFSLGRAEDNEIVLAYPFVSTQHAVITIKEEDNLSFHIKDTGSTNGTFKNGVQIEEADFQLQDSILLGSYELQASDFLPLYYAKSNTSHGGNPLKRNKKQIALPLALISLVLVLAYFVIDLSSMMDFPFFNERNLIIGLGLWILCLLSLQLLQEVRRNSRLRKTEQAYFDFVQERWREQADLAITRQKQSDKTVSAWNGFRKFELMQRVDECQDIVSFYLRPHDGVALPSFKPGQYLTFRLHIDNHPKPVIRCYSLSDSQKNDYYRVSIKRIRGSNDGATPDGVSSSYFHTQVQLGDILDVKAPSGQFYLDTDKEKAIVLIAGGIGITPMLSMLNTIIEKQIKREVWLFYGVRNKAEHVMPNYLKQVSNEYDNIHLRVLYSKPSSKDQIGLDYSDKGRVTVDYLKTQLPSNNYDYYLCGPGAMMADVAQDLENWGVPQQDIYSEAFGPAKVTKKSSDLTSPKEINVETKPAKVTFARSGKTVNWTDAEESLLALAEKNDVPIDFGCRAGNCGTCLVALRSGKVNYTSDHDVMPEKGSCLCCITIPNGDITLDA